MAGGKPSEMFVKYRFFDMGEKYNPSIHNLGDTIRERGEQFYSEEDLIRMEEELEEERLERLKIARCIISTAGAKAVRERVCNWARGN